MGVRYLCSEWSCIQCLVYIASESEDFHQLELILIEYTCFNPDEKVINDSVRVEHRSSCGSASTFSMTSRVISNQSHFKVGRHVQRRQHGLRNFQMPNIQSNWTIPLHATCSWLFSDFFAGADTSLLSHGAMKCRLSLKVWLVIRLSVPAREPFGLLEVSQRILTFVSIVMTCLCVSCSRKILFKLLVKRFHHTSVLHAIYDLVASLLSFFLAQSVPFNDLGRSQMTFSCQPDKDCLVERVTPVMEGVRHFCVRAAKPKQCQLQREIEVNTRIQTFQQRKILRLRYCCFCHHLSRPCRLHRRPARLSQAYRGCKVYQKK